jgi:hypothetical protein
MRRFVPSVQPATAVIFRSFSLAFSARGGSSPGKQARGIASRPAHSFSIDRIDVSQVTLRCNAFL